MASDLWMALIALKVKIWASNKMQKEERSSMGKWGVQSLSPVAPLLSGFRLDAFSVIKPRVTHSPSPDAGSKDMLMLLDEPHKTVTVAEYSLPEAKPGTHMYFDFPRKIQTCRVVFRLLGDVASFINHPAKQDDSTLRATTVAAGLSLSNMVKLYYYADPYELRKWAILWAV